MKLIKERMREAGKKEIWRERTKAKKTTRNKYKRWKGKTMKGKK
jgi:hypothetical protein